MGCPTSQEQQVNSQWHPLPPNQSIERDHLYKTDYEIVKPAVLVLANHSPQACEILSREIEASDVSGFTMERVADLWWICPASPPQLLVEEGGRMLHSHMCHGTERSFKTPL